jgi:hypothetical protein
MKMKLIVVGLLLASTQVMAAPLSKHCAAVRDYGIASMYNLSQGATMDEILNGPLIMNDSANWQFDQLSDEERSDIVLSARTVLYRMENVNIPADKGALGEFGAIVAQACTHSVDY